MQKASFDRVLELLDVHLDAFAVCEIGDGCALEVDPLDTIVVHYVLQGEGSIECEHGSFPIREGAMVVVPKKLRKRINGAGPIVTVRRATESCPLTDTMVKFRACENEADLVLGCGSVSAMVGDIGLFDHLTEPLVVTARAEALPLMFRAVLAELARPGIGTKPIVEGLMKQILILLLRSHLKRVGTESPIYLTLMNPELGRALMAMTASPHKPHSLDSLAALAGMSRSRFAYHFARAYGRSPMDYLQSVRLRAAARLLRSSGMLVKSISAAVGFQSRSHFSRAFRAEYGVDPSAFRDRADAESLLAAAGSEAGGDPGADDQLQGMEQHDRQDHHSRRRSGEQDSRHRRPAGERLHRAAE